MHRKTMQSHSLSVHGAGSECSSFQQGHFYHHQLTLDRLHWTLGFALWLHPSEGCAAKDKSRHSFPREILEPSVPQAIAPQVLADTGLQAWFDEMGMGRSLVLWLLLLQLAMADRISTGVKVKHEGQFHSSFKGTAAAHPEGCSLPCFQEGFSGFAASSKTINMFQTDYRWCMEK